MNYTKEKIAYNHYKVNVDINGEEHTFQCIVANDTQEDLDEIVQWNIDNLNAPQFIYQPSYSEQRKAEYPRIEEYLDGIVKGDQEQINKYIADCLAVKEKYPKQ
jgi:hypothetical protein